ncbi:hypothetical protein Hanom_Chr12g01084531 [Helianthus anomalus]
MFLSCTQNNNATQLVLRAHKEVVNSLAGTSNAKLGTVFAVVSAANSTAIESSKEIQAAMQISRRNALGSLMNKPPDAPLDDFTIMKQTLRVKDEDLQNLARDIRARDSTIKEIAKKLTKTAEVAESAASAAHMLDEQRRIATSEVDHFKKELEKQAGSYIFVLWFRGCCFVAWSGRIITVRFNMVKMAAGTMKICNINWYNIKHVWIGNKRWLHQDVFGCCCTVFSCASLMLPGYDESWHLWIQNLLSDFKKMEVVLLRLLIMMVMFVSAAKMGCTLLDAKNMLLCLGPDFVTQLKDWVLKVLTCLMLLIKMKANHICWFIVSGYGLGPKSAC